MLFDRQVAGDDAIRLLDREALLVVATDEAGGVWSRVIRPDDKGSWQRIPGPATTCNRPAREVRFVIENPLEESEASFEVMDLALEILAVSHSHVHGSFWMPPTHSLLRRSAQRKMPTQQLCTRRPTRLKKLTRS